MLRPNSIFSPFNRDATSVYHWSRGLVAPGCHSCREKEWFKVNALNRENKTWIMKHEDTVILSHTWFKVPSKTLRVFKLGRQRYCLLTCGNIITPLAPRYTRLRTHMWDEPFSPTSKQVFCYRSLPAKIKSIIAEERIFGVEACLEWIRWLIKV